ncbi:MAG: hypothetical protein JKY52_08315 [Flavobacteriales bacterium]|nr:hypothetical protein [Flavobacteriales bacterium]
MTLTQQIRAHIEALNAEDCDDKVDVKLATNINFAKSTAVLAFYNHGADFARHLLAENSRILKALRKLRGEQLIQPSEGE